MSSGVRLSLEVEGMKVVVLSLEGDGGGQAKVVEVEAMLAEMTGSSVALLDWGLGGLLQLNAAVWSSLSLSLGSAGWSLTADLM